MAKTKKTANKKTASKNKIIEIKVINDVLKPKQTANIKTAVPLAGKTGLIKVYPPIYTYIYEREPEDMARIYEEHKTVQETKKITKKITGFKLVDNKLVAVAK